MSSHITGLIGLIVFGIIILIILLIIGYKIYKWLSKERYLQEELEAKNKIMQQKDNKILSLLRYRN